MTKIITLDKVLLSDICRIIDDARKGVAVAANSALTLMYWHIGDKIHNYVLERQRATYGQQIVSALSTQLTERYGKDFTTRNLRWMRLMYIKYPKCQTLSSQLAVNA